MLENLEIEGKVVELKFGLNFIRHFDNKYQVTQNGLKFGQGIDMVASLLVSSDPLILIDVIKAGTENSTAKPTQREIETFLESQEDLEWLFDGFLERLKTNALTKVKVLKVIDRIEKAEEEKTRQ